MPGPLRCLLVVLMLCAVAHAATLWVDDDAPNDPAAGGSAVSDPAEDGTPEHPFDAIQQAIDAAVDGDEVSGASMRVADCCFRDGGGDAAIGTIRSSSGDVELVRNVLTDNRSYGIYLAFLASVRIEDCEIAGHTQAGIVTDRCGATHVTGCRVLRNYGTGVSLWGVNPADLLMANCLVAGNRANTCSGVYIRSFTGLFLNNTVVGNVSENDGAVALDIEPGEIAVANCILWNHANELPDGCEAAHSCVRGGAPGIGNIAAYPHFVDPYAGDYHLSSSSPCIDAGDTASVAGGYPDLDGEARVQLAAADIGADEAPAASPDTDGDGLPDDWEREQFGSLAQGPDDDPDGDEVTNIEEYRNGTDPGSGVATVYVSIANAGDPLADCTIAHPFPTIQQGVDAASRRVAVAEGTYAEHVFLPSLPLDIEGGYSPDFGERDSDAHATVIDAGGAGSAVIAAGMPGGSLSGLGITGAADSGLRFTGSILTIADCRITGNASQEYGGGMHINGGDVLLTGNTISGNTADLGGGGICTVDSSPTIIGNVISGNTSDDGESRGYGGGACCIGSGSPIIDGNTISGNAARGSTGISCTDDVHAVIKRNEITANTTTAGGTGGLYCGSTRACTIAGNTISGNTSNSDGGGLRLTGYAAATATNNTIEGNSADEGAGIYLSARASHLVANNRVLSNTARYEGGGIYNDGDLTRPVFRTNTIMGNSAGTGGGMYMEQRYKAALLAGNIICENAAASDGGGVSCTKGSLDIIACTIAFNSAGSGRGGGINGNEWGTTVNCIVWGNGDDLTGGTPAYCCVTDPADAPEGSGSIAACPHFAAPGAGDYHLLPISPCIDAGDPAYAPALGEMDIEGNPRVIGSAVDMGAYERPLAELTAADFTVPAAITPGVPFIVRWQVHNAGPELSAGCAWSDGVCLCRGAGWSQTAILLAERSSEDVLPLAQGAQYEREATCTVAPDVRAGTWYLVLKTDCRDAFGEPDEDGNTLVSRVTLLWPGVFADVNQDDRVNVADLLMVRAYLGISGSMPGRADVNADGICNIADLLMVRSNPGNGPGCN